MLGWKLNLGQDYVLDIDLCLFLELLLTLYLRYSATTTSTIVDEPAQRKVVNDLIVERAAVYDKECQEDDTEESNSMSKPNQYVIRSHTLSAYVYHWATLANSF